MFKFQFIFILNIATLKVKMFMEGNKVKEVESVLDLRIILVSQLFSLIH